MIVITFYSTTLRKLAWYLLKTKSPSITVVYCYNITFNKKNYIPRSVFYSVLFISTFFIFFKCVFKRVSRSFIIHAFEKLVPDQ
jgi:hypothetical protein